MGLVDYEHGTQMSDMRQGNYLGREHPALHFHGRVEFLLMVVVHVWFYRESSLLMRKPVALNEPIENRTVGMR